MCVFAERIQEVRESLGMNKTQFADYVGVTLSTISRYESGSMSIGLDAVATMAEKLNVSPGWLLGWTDEKYITEKESKDVKAIPILGVIAAGKPILASEYIEGYEYGEDNADFCLRIKGNSMIGARIYDGDTVFVKRQSDVENGDIAVVLVNGDEATVKRVYKYGKSIVLHPENPTNKDIILTHGDTVSILGRVVAVKFKVR